MFNGCGGCVKFVMALVLIASPLSANAQNMWKVVETDPAAVLAFQMINNTSPRQATVGYFFTTPTDTNASGDTADYTLVGMEFDCYAPRTRALVQKNYRLNQPTPLLVGENLGRWETIVHPSQQKVWESVCGAKDHAIERFDTIPQLMKWLRAPKK